MEQKGQGPNLDTEGIVDNAGDALEVPLIDNPHDNPYDMGYRGRHYEGLRGMRIICVVRIWGGRWTLPPLM